MFTETFTTHPWRIKSQETQQVLGHYVGQTAVVEITQTLACKVHPGIAKHVCPKQAAVPSHWGDFRPRSKINGIDIMVRMLKGHSRLHTLMQALL